MPETPSLSERPETLCESLETPEVMLLLYMYFRESGVPPEDALLQAISYTGVKD